MESVTGVGVSSGGPIPATGDTPEAAFAIPEGTANAAAATSARIRPNLATLSNGDRGSDVRLLQRSLSALGYNPGTADGIFGNRTEAAVRAFQSDRGIGIDGIVGRGETWPALLGSLTSRRDSLVQAVADVPGPGFPASNDPIDTDPPGL